MDGNQIRLEQSRWDIVWTRFPEISRVLSFMMDGDIGEKKARKREKESDLSYDYEEIK